MRGKYGNLPKCLMPVKGESLLTRNVRLLNKLGIDDIGVVVGAEGSCWTDDNIDLVRKIVPKIYVNKRNLSSDNTLSLHVALRQASNTDTIIIDGDLAISKEIIELFISTKHSALLMKASESDDEKRNRIRHRNGRVLEIGKHIPLSELEKPYFIYGAVIKVIATDLNLFKTIVKSLINDARYSDSQSIIGGLNLFVKQANVTFVSSDAWFNINIPEDYENALNCIDG